MGSVLESHISEMLPRCPGGVCVISQHILFASLRERLRFGGGYEQPQFQEIEDIRNIWFLPFPGNLFVHISRNLGKKMANSSILLFHMLAVHRLQDDRFSGTDEEK